MFDITLLVVKSVYCVIFEISESLCDSRFFTVVWKVRFSQANRIIIHANNYCNACVVRFVRKISSCLVVRVSQVLMNVLITSQTFLGIVKPTESTSWLSSSSTVVFTPRWRSRVFCENRFSIVSANIALSLE